MTPWGVTMADYITIVRLISQLNRIFGINFVTSRSIKLKLNSLSGRFKTNFEAEFHLNATTGKTFTSP